MTLKGSLSVQKIIGSSILSNNFWSVNETKSELYFVAGSCINSHSYQNSNQLCATNLIINSTKVISCTTVSKDGKYLAYAEKGKNSTCVVIDLLFNKQICVVGQSHKYGIGCISFIPKTQYLITIGFKNDKSLIISDITTGKALSIQRVSNKVHSIACHSSGNVFVTSGDRHLKFWNIIQHASTDNGVAKIASAIEPQVSSTSSVISTNIEVIGQPASILEDHSRSIFVSICFGEMKYSDILYCITSHGIVCQFSVVTRSVENYIQLTDVDTAFCIHWLSVPTICNSSTVTSEYNHMLAVGCSDGAIHIVCPDTLNSFYKLTLPSHQPNFQPSCFALSHIFHLSNTTSANDGQASGDSNVSLVASYSDKSIVSWDLKGVINHISNKPNSSSTSTFFNSQYNSILSAHSACAWDLVFLSTPNSAALSPIIKFVTCSADNSIRFWSVRKNDAGNNLVPTHSDGVIRIYDDIKDGSNEINTNSLFESHNQSLDFTKLNQSSLPSQSVYSSTTTATTATATTTSSPSKLPDTESPDTSQSKFCPRTLAKHPTSSHLVCGTRSGLLLVYDITSVLLVSDSNMDSTNTGDKEIPLIESIPAHSAEILTLQYSPSLRQINTSSLSSPLSDQWIVDDDGDVINQLSDNTTSSTTTQPLILLATAGRDKFIHIYDASTDKYTLLATLDNHTASVTVLKFTTDGQKLISCGGDHTMNIFSVNGPQITLLKSIQTPHSVVSGLSIDSTNRFAVTCGNDKRLHILNLRKGGKLMRSYTCDGSAEFYKVDVDSSGK